MSGRAKRHLIVAAAFALAVPLIAQGRAPARPARCTMPDSSKPWFTRQRAWLDDSRRTWSNDSLRQLLVSAARIDASRPLPVQLGWSLPGAGSVSKDSVGLAFVRTQLRQPRGSPFPTRSVVGAGGVRAVWLLALGDSAAEAAVMRRFMEAGLGEAFEADIAVLEDRVRNRAGRGQLYGTALHVPTEGGSRVPFRVEDSAHVDLRRDAAGLPPLSQSLCAANSAER